MRKVPFRCFFFENFFSTNSFSIKGLILSHELGLTLHNRFIDTELTIRNNCNYISRFRQFPVHNCLHAPKTTNSTTQTKLPKSQYKALTYKVGKPQEVSPSANFKSTASKLAAITKTNAQSLSNFLYFMHFQNAIF